MARRLADDEIAREQTENVLRTEALTIHSSKLSDKDNTDLKADLINEKGPGLYRALNRLDSAALCLSGGGIRSAAFSLGVIQALASHPRSEPRGNDKPGAPCARADQCLLTRFHYLSTVSGGGYIGSWLSAWRSRAPWTDIWRDLTSRLPDRDQEARALGWLRSYSNYLTPKMGLMSADTWAATALFIRNLVLNWIIIIPAFCVIVLLLKLLAIFSDWSSSEDQPVSLQAAFAIGGVLCLILALSFEIKNLPSQRSDGDTGPDQRTFLWRAVVPAYLSAALLTQFLVSEDLGKLLLWDPDLLGQDTSGAPRSKFSLYIVVLSGAACGALIYAISWLASRIGWSPGNWRSWSAARAAISRQAAHVGSKLTYLLAWSTAGAVYGSLVALGVYVYSQIPQEGILSIHGEALFSLYVLHVVVGLPWIILSQLIADMIFVGLTDNRYESDADREWLGRAAGWLMAAAIGWLVLSFTVFFGAILGPQIVTPDMQAAVRSWATTLAGIFGFVTAILGMSSASPARGPAKTRKASIVNFALSIAAPLFVVALLIGLSFFLDQLLMGTSLVPELFCWWNGDTVCWGHRRLSVDALEDLQDLLWVLRVYPERDEAVGRLIGGLIVFGSLAVAASHFININRFSLHAMYRNRLIRAFLGASRNETASSERRNADKFIGFDLKDNPRVQDLWPQPQPSEWGPFHIVNIALNVVSGERLAWQERKAEPFTVTPLHSGSRYLGFRSRRSPRHIARHRDGDLGRRRQPEHGL
jgi:Patatin-like phospholipase